MFSCALLYCAPRMCFLQTEGRALYQQKGYDSLDVDTCFIVVWNRTRGVCGIGLLEGRSLPGNADPPSQGRVFGRDVFSVSLRAVQAALLRGVGGLTAPAQLAFCAAWAALGEKGRRLPRAGRPRRAPPLPRRAQHSEKENEQLGSLLGLQKSCCEGQILEPSEGPLHTFVLGLLESPLGTWLLSWLGQEWTCSLSLSWGQPQGHSWPPTPCLLTSRAGALASATTGPLHSSFSGRCLPQCHDRPNL